MWCAWYGLCVIVGIGCSAASPRATAVPSPSPPASNAPAPIALPPALSGRAITLVLGDYHGTRELPAFVDGVVRTLAAREPVVLGLEIPAEQTPSLPAFLDSDGGPGARAAVLRDPWWQDRYQDGRRSEAMLGVLDTVRTLRAAGRRIDVVCFDVTLPPPVDAELREAAMARTLIATRAAHPDAALVIFAGNLHTRRAAFDGIPGFAWLGMRLGSAGVSFTTLAPRWRDGSAWTCPDADPDHCGARFARGSMAPPGIWLEPSPDGAYDGWFDVGPVTASPPAAFADRASARTPRP